MFAYEVIFEVFFHVHNLFPAKHNIRGTVFSYNYIPRIFLDFLMCPIDGDKTIPKKLMTGPLCPAPRGFRGLAWLEQGICYPRLGEFWILLKCAETIDPSECLTNSIPSQQSGSVFFRLGLATLIVGRNFDNCLIWETADIRGHLETLAVSIQVLSREL
jgi:hypothetical protein